MYREHGALGFIGQGRIDRDWNGIQKRERMSLVKWIDLKTWTVEGGIQSILILCGGRRKRKQWRSMEEGATNVAGWFGRRTAGKHLHASGGYTGFKKTKHERVDCKPSMSMQVTKWKGKEKGGGSRGPINATKLFEMWDV